MLCNINNAIIKTITAKELNNVRAEFKAIIIAFEAVKLITTNDTPIFYTDCNSIINLIGRRAYLEANSYYSKKNKCILANADIYKEFFSLYDILRPKLVWVKGHSPKKDEDYIKTNFSYIDRLLRKNLRASIA